MKLTGDEAREIVWECNKDWEQIEYDLVDNNRWSLFYEGVFKHIPTGKYYKFEWSKGATEYQDEKPFQYTKEVIPVEVHSVEKTVQVWEVVQVWEPRSAT